MLFDARAITLKPCGVRNVAENYLDNLKNYFEIYAIVNSNSSHLINSNVKKIEAPRFCSRFGFLGDFWISYLITKLKPDIFFSAHSFLPIFAFLPKIRVFICHDLFAAFDKNFFAKKGCLAPLARFYFRILAEVSFLRASLVVAPSTAIKESFKKLICNSKKIEVIHNGISNSITKAPNNKKDKNILFVGNFREYKGFDILYKAWVNFNKMNIEHGWVLNVVTNENNETIEAYTKNKDFKKINYYSKISNDELMILRNKSKLSVIPSRDEGFGIPMLEALASSEITICSDIPVFRELANDFDGSVIEFFVSESSSDLESALNNSIIRLENSNFKSKTKHNNDILRNKFSWEVSSEKLYFALDNLLSRKNLVISLFPPNGK